MSAWTFGISPLCIKFSKGGRGTAEQFRSSSHIASMNVCWKKFVSCLLAPFLLLCLRQYLTLGIQESIVLATLLLTIGLWITGAVPKWLSSAFLLLVFSFARSAPLNKIFQFPLSENFIMIVFSDLFSQGLQNSGIFEILLPVLQKRIHGKISLAGTIFVCSLCMIWIVPQPFARIIILLQLYTTMFQIWGFSEQTRHILCFWIVNSAIFINCAFLRGDIILNYALLNTSGLPLTEKVWMQWMLVPTFIFYVLGLLLFFLLFHTQLGELRGLDGKAFVPQTKKMDASAAVIGCITVVLWLTESWTGISAAWTVLGASVAMFATGLLKKSDLKSVNIELMLFLSAAFSIGPVVTESRIAQRLFNMLLPFLSKRFSFSSMIVLLVLSILLHMILGSCVTALSVAVPGLLIVCQETMPAYPVAFIAFLGIVVPYLFPLHNVSIMVGAGKGGYPDDIVLRYGTALTAYVICAIPIIYGGYWSLCGLI